MLDESYMLQYTQSTLLDMSEEKRSIFETPLRKFVIATTVNQVTRTVFFHMYQDHFLEAVERWPWLLCSNLGAHLESCYMDDEERERLRTKAVHQLYSTQPPFHVRKAKP